MKLFVCLFAGAALAQDFDIFSLSGTDDSYSYYYDEFGNIPSNVTEERGNKKPLIRDDPGSCLICNVEGADYSAALNECRKKGKFVQCNIDSDPQKKNICELTERRNNAKVYLTSNCNQKQACLESQGQNKRQCIRFGATDRKFINPSYKNTNKLSI
jgi:hypothetical protein